MQRISSCWTIVTRVLSGAGANLEGSSKTRFAEINTELSKLSLKFGENVLAETNSLSIAGNG